MVDILFTLTDVLNENLIIDCGKYSKVSCLAQTCVHVNGALTSKFSVKVSGKVEGAVSHFRIFTCLEK